MRGDTIETEREAAMQLLSMHTVVDQPLVPLFKTKKQLENTTTKTRNSYGNQHFSEIRKRSE